MGFADKFMIYDYDYAYAYGSFGFWTGWNVGVVQKLVDLLFWLYILYNVEKHLTRVACLDVVHPS